MESESKWIKILEEARQHLYVADRIIREVQVEISAEMARREAKKG